MGYNERVLNFDLNTGNRNYMICRKQNKKIFEACSDTDRRQRPESAVTEFLGSHGRSQGLNLQLILIWSAIAPLIDMIAKNYYPSITAESKPCYWKLLIHTTTRSWRIDYSAKSSLGTGGNQWQIPFITFLVLACS